MQLYALKDGLSTPINKALKQLDYECPECGSIVRARGGLHRHDHFYHLRKTPDCKLSGKSQAHLDIQNYIGQDILMIENPL